MPYLSRIELHEILEEFDDSVCDHAMFQYDSENYFWWDEANYLRWISPASDNDRINFRNEKIERYMKQNGYSLVFTNEGYKLK